jgi:hypothetical protein
MTREERRAAFESVLAEVRTGPGRLAGEVRQAAANGAPVPGPLSPLVDHIRGGATQVTDDDIARARAAGHDDDQLFELTVATALGESGKRLRAVLAALGRGR